MRTVVLAACGLVAFGGPVAGQPPQPARAGELEPFPVARELKLDSNQLPSLALSPNGRVLAVADGVFLRFWNPRTGEEAAIPWNFAPDPTIIAVPLHPAFVDDATIAVGRNRKELALHEYPSGRVLHTFECPRHVWSDGWTVAPGLFACAGTHDVRVFTGPKWEESWRVGIPEFPPALAFSPDRSELAVGYRTEGVVRVYSVKDGTLLRMSRSRLVAGDLRELAYAPDGRALVFLGRPHPDRRPAPFPHLDDWRGVSFLDAKLAEHRTLPWGGPGDRPRDPLGCVFSPDGKTLLVPCGSGSVRLYEVQTGALRHVGAVPCRRFAVSPDGKWFASVGAGRVVVADWRAAKPGDPLVREPAALWVDLASADGAKGYRAVVALGARPAEAVRLIGANLKPAAVPDAAAVKALIADLAADDFATREAAQKELAGLAELVEPELRDAAKSDSPERRDRANEVLKALSRGDHPEQLRRLRSVEVLEYLGTPPARDALKALAAGTPSARLTQDAKAALDRLRASDSKP